MTDAMETGLPLLGDRRAYGLRSGRVVVHTALPGGGRCETFADEAAFRKACPDIPPEDVWRSRFAGAGRKEERR